MSEHPKLAKQYAQQIYIELVKAHIYHRERVLNNPKKLFELNELFLIQDLRAFWQQAFIRGYLDHMLKDMYDACQSYWFHCSDSNTYMDVMRWKKVPAKINYYDFVEMMEKSYKKSHSQQMRRWREKYASKLEEYPELTP